MCTRIIKVMRLGAIFCAANVARTFARSKLGASLQPSAHSSPGNNRDNPRGLITSRTLTSGGRNQTQVFTLESEVRGERCGRTNKSVNNGSYFSHNLTKRKYTSSLPALPAMLLLVWWRKHSAEYTLLSAFIIHRHMRRERGLYGEATLQLRKEKTGSSLTISSGRELYSFIFLSRFAC